MLSITLSGRVVLRVTRREFASQLDFKHSIGFVLSPIKVFSVNAKDVLGNRFTYCMVSDFVCSLEFIQDFSTL